MLSPVVLTLRLLYLILDSRRLKRLCWAWVESIAMLVALWASVVDVKKGRQGTNYSLCGFHYVLRWLAAWGGTAPKLHSDADGKDAVNGVLVEVAHDGNNQLLREYGIEFWTIVNEKHYKPLVSRWVRERWSAVDRALSVDWLVG